MSAPAEELTTSERTFAVRVVRRRRKASGMSGAFDRYSMAKKAAEVRAERPRGRAACIVKRPSVAAIVNAYTRRINPAVTVTAPGMSRRFDVSRGPPPAIEPAANPADRIETRTPKARLRSFPSGNVAARIARAVAVVMAAATP